MDNENLVTLIQHNAQTINKLMDNINRTVANRDADPQPWKKACEEFNTQYDALAFPGGAQRALDLLKKNDPEVIDTAIVYLKVNPHYHRSGYLKEKLVDLLKRVQLTDQQTKQLQGILIAAIKNVHQREYREYCRLAAKIGDDSFKQLVQEALQTLSDPQELIRAQQMLDALKNNK